MEISACAHRAERQNRAREDRPVDFVAGASLVTCFARFAFARCAFVVVAIGPLAGCVSEVEPQKTVTLPKEAYRYERFIEAATIIEADHVTVQLLTHYRKKDIAIVTSDAVHLKRETPDRIELKSRDESGFGDPLGLTVRNMNVRARRSITVIFSDVPLLRNEDPPVIVLVHAEGLVRFRGDGVELHEDRVIVRNDEVKGFSTDGSLLGTGRR
jgi:hypothetical protein